MTRRHGLCSWSVWTTTARVVTSDAAALDEVVLSVRQVLADVDAAANRFDPGSELSRLTASARTGPRCVSPVLYSLLSAALDAAAATDGLVDPTVAATLDDLGYDRTFPLIVGDHARALPVRVRRPVGWQDVTLDEQRRTVTVPAGCRLDLGATAKAWAADSAARTAAERTGTGVLVSLGGDVAVAGPAPGAGWPVTIADDHGRPQPQDPQVLVRSGGLATSSTTTRTWKRGNRYLHHIIDPRTAHPARSPWRTVTVAAASCVDANAAATAAIICGASAASWLAGLKLPARLVDTAGHVTTVADWPAPVAAAS